MSPRITPRLRVKWAGCYPYSTVKSSDPGALSEIAPNVYRTADGKLSSAEGCIQPKSKNAVSLVRILAHCRQA